MDEELRYKAAVISPASFGALAFDDWGFQPHVTDSLFVAAQCTAHALPNEFHLSD